MECAENVKDITRQEVADYLLDMFPFNQYQMLMRREMCQGTYTWDHYDISVYLGGARGQSPEYQAQGNSWASALNAIRQQMETARSLPPKPCKECGRLPEGYMQKMGMEQP